jgi:hypothetical protein
MKQIPVNFLMNKMRMKIEYKEFKKELENKDVDSNDKSI